MKIYAVEYTTFLDGGSWNEADIMFFADREDAKSEYKNSRDAWPIASVSYITIKDAEDVVALLSFANDKERANDHYTNNLAFEWKTIVRRGIKNNRFPIKQSSIAGKKV
tara:strand:- start:4993 stop:5319 length:327 start_codon:yes stop_codon:yes gene_type:complete